MKTIGMLGGASWMATISYYRTLNELVAQRLGGFHSAKILLKSVDYHDFRLSYGKSPEEGRAVFKRELEELIAFQPGCIIICNNTLHKYYDMIKHELDSSVPVMHAVELAAQRLVDDGQRKVLLLATKFTMEDGFFAKILQRHGIEVVIPNQVERDRMHEIHSQLMRNVVTDEARDYFIRLIKTYADCDAVVLGCTEYPMVVDETNSALPIVNSIQLQAEAAVNYALADVALPDESFTFLDGVAPEILESARYYTNENFLGRRVAGYLTDRIVVTKKVARQLKKVNADLKQSGYRLVVYDAYRPQVAVDDFIAWSQAPSYQATPSEMAAKQRYYPTLDKSKLFELGYLYERSQHTDGIAVDLTLIEPDQSLKLVVHSTRKLTNGEEVLFLDDNTVDMGTSFDLFHAASDHDSPLISQPCLRMRNFLRDIMTKHGFKAYEKEWWHYSLE